jgi:3-oxoacyl-[acyl-carrier protein] reductase
MSKNILVTGSTKGIGLEIARKFNNSGWKVLATSRSDVNISDFRKEFDYQENVSHFKVDFLINAEISKLKIDIENFYGKIDCLVINVGTGSGTRGINSDFVQNLQQLENNFFTAYRTLKILKDTLTKSDNSRVIIIGSVAGKVNVGAPINYSAAKYALVNLMKNYVKILSKDGISLNLINPGHTLTMDGLWEKKIKLDPEGVQKMLSEYVPLNKIGLGSDLAEFTYLLTLMGSNYLNGAQIDLDGGLTITH